MDVRGLVLVVGVVGASALALTSACATPDPGEITYSERHGGTGEPGTSNGNPGTSSGTSGTPTDGGSSGTTDDGGSSGTAINAFTGAPAYNAAGAANGSSTNQGGHGGQGAPPSQDCGSCHGPAGGAASKWGFAGQVVNAMGGTTGLAKAEIRVVDGTGKEIDKVYSDAQGYFWSSAAAPAAGALVGVRMGAKPPMLMAGKLAAGDGSCGKAGTCHGGTQGKIYFVP